jgi:aminoglycoside phosphotransferase (APT) family kinase protein
VRWLADHDGIRAEEEEDVNPRSDMDTAVRNPTLADEPGLTLYKRFARLQDPSEALEILQSYVPSCPARVKAICTPQKYYRRDDGRDDRFIVRVDTATSTGQREAFVFKGYANDRGEEIMHAFHALATCPACPPDTCPVSRPLAYVAHERVLISRWVHGPTVWARITHGYSDVLARVPAVLTHLYRAEVRPEAATSARTLLDEALTRGEKVCTRWPAAAGTVQPLMAALQEGLLLLDPTPPALVHGDLKPEHCLWNGRHVTLIDLDSFCYTDPAYDAGRLLARLHRQCLHHPALMPRVRQMLATFRTAFLSAVPTVSARNVSFYYALQFAREICRDLGSVQVPANWPRVIASYAHHARSALRTDVWPDGAQRSSTPRFARTSTAPAAS